MTTDARRRAWLDANQQGVAAELARVAAAIRGTEASEAPRVPARALDRLCRLFGLSAFERDVLLLCAGVELDSGFAETVGQPTVALALAKLPHAHWAALSPAAPLRHWRLIEVAAGRVR